MKILNENEKKKKRNDKMINSQKPQNQDQKAKKRGQEHEEMSIDSGAPDLENEAKDSDKAE